MSDIACDADAVKTVAEPGRYVPDTEPVAKIPADPPETNGEPKPVETRRRQRGWAVTCPRPGCDGDCFVTNTRRYPECIEIRRRNYKCGTCGQTFSTVSEIQL